LPSPFTHPLPPPPGQRVVCLDFHLSEPGFFPQEDGSSCSQTKESWRIVNVPFRRGVSAARFAAVFRALFAYAYARVRPDAVVLQCGCDALGRDPTRALNLDSVAMCSAVQQVVSTGCKLLLLGGGGYEPTNVARVWTQVIANLARVSLSKTVPRDTHDWPFRLAPYMKVPMSETMQDANSKGHLRLLLDTARRRLDTCGTKLHAPISGNKSCDRDRSDSDSEEEEPRLKRRRVFAPLNRSVDQTRPNADSAESPFDF
ncbi:MAG: hypothetical protein MHM6MM_002358, partial [Cercozoa sp. M6MM]